MRSKRFLSTVITTALVVTTMAMPVMAADQGGFDVDVTTKTPVIRVVVPTSMDVAINQFEMGDAGSQIFSSAFGMENKSQIPVKMTITSTATIPATTKLVATKAGATGSTAEGDAWLAVAAQTSDGNYIEESGKTINDLNETSANVTTFVDGKAEQTYYLNASSGMKYKLLNASESAADIQYAQFYQLDVTTFATSKEDDELKAALKEKDIYMIPTASIDDGAEVIKVVDDGSLSWNTANTYYEVSPTATAKEDIVSTNLYLYGDGTTDTAGKAAFRYIGKLSGEKETWDAEDLSKISVNYKIVGVQQNSYDELAGQTGVLTYGLYKAPTPPATAPNIATKTYSYDRTADLSIAVTLGSGSLAAEDVASVSWSATETGTYAEFAKGTKWSYSNGTLTFKSGIWGTGSVGDVKYLKVTFNDSASTAVTLTLTISK